MADAYTGEIRMFAGSFAPFGWAFCDGQILPKKDYEDLFKIIGNAYGGDGINNFALPDLRGRVPINKGMGPNTSDRVIGQKVGAEKAAITNDQLPAHSHPVVISTAAGTSASPANAFWAANAYQYSSNFPNGYMSADTIELTGNNAAHDNMMPYLCVSFIICVQGGFDPRD